MSAHPSLGRQITWRLSVLFIFALVLSSAIFFFASWIHRVDSLDKRLQGVAAKIADAVERDPAGVLRIRPASLTVLQFAEIPSLRYAVRDAATGSIADGSTTGLVDEAAAARSRLRNAGGFNFIDAGGQSERGYIFLSELPAGHLQVLVSSPNLGLADTMAWMKDETMSELVPVLAPLFVGTLLVAPLTIRHSLKPLGRLSAQATEIEPTHTDVRLNEDGIPSEILPLVEKINEALARVDEGFEQQRRFTSNAAHELRTPLAILRARIDGLDKSPTKEGLIRDVERMSRLITQLLLAGRLEMRAAAPDAPVDIAAVASETLERLRLLPAARDHELSLKLPDQPVIVAGDAELLGDALRNLIDNAIAYSPSGLPVEIEVTAEAAVEVRDRGPGIPANIRERIFERFWRAQGSGGEGAGLGLSIVKTIVAQHRGSIVVSDNPGGGAIFRLQFPRQSRGRDESRQATG